MAKTANTEETSHEDNRQAVGNTQDIEELRVRIKSFAKIRLHSGYLILLLLFIFGKPEILYYIIGTAFILSGSLQRIMAAGTLVKAAKNDAGSLIIAGPYRKCRHPLYFGSFLNGIGFAFLAGPLMLMFPPLEGTLIGLLPWGVIPLLVLLGPIYYRMIKIEEEFLAFKFGVHFDAYRRHIPCFFPKLSTPGGDQDWRFDGEKLRENREMRNFGWLMAAYVLFILKLFYHIIINFSAN